MNAPLDKSPEEVRPETAAGERRGVAHARAAEAARPSAAFAYLWVGVGSALGGIARYGAGLAIAASLGDAFPWATILINVSGSMLIGFFATLTGPDGRVYVPTPGRQFVMAGFCGGYTTFSSFALQTLTLAQDGHPLRAAANIAASLALCFTGVWVGHAAATALNG